MTDDCATRDGAAQQLPCIAFLERCSAVRSEEADSAKESSAQEASCAMMMACRRPDSPVPLLAGQLQHVLTLQQRRSRSRQQRLQQQLEAVTQHQQQEQEEEQQQQQQHQQQQQEQSPQTPLALPPVLRGKPSLLQRRHARSLPRLCESPEFPEESAAPLPQLTAAQLSVALSTADDTYTDLQLDTLFEQGLRDLDQGVCVSSSTPPVSPAFLTASPTSDFAPTPSPRHTFPTPAASLRQSCSSSPLSFPASEVAIASTTTTSLKSEECRRPSGALLDPGYASRSGSFAIDSPVEH
eukprot:m.92028 g.92028  ORF g.92028 m.92028 type:complete len:296 (-) comp18262_c2_seq1:58-945(-)